MIVWGGWVESASTGIGRLARPLADASAALCWRLDNRHQQRFARDAAGLVLIRCGILRRAFWDWSTQDWVDLISVRGSDFRRSWPGQIGPNARPLVIAYAYLLGGFIAFDRLGRFQRPTLARRVFGARLVDDVVGRICGVLTGWGYRREERHLTSVICHMLLINHSPCWKTLSTLIIYADP